MKNIFLIALAGFFLFSGTFSPRSAAAQEAAAPATIETVEVKDDAAVGEEHVSLEDVEQARALTPDRLYVLAGFWVLIALAVFLIRCQVRDDQKLYDEGYYDRDLQ